MAAKAISKKWKPMTHNACGARCRYPEVTECVTWRNAPVYDDGTRSSPELTAAYVEAYCSRNHLKYSPDDYAR